MLTYTTIYKQAKFMDVEFLSLNVKVCERIRHVCC